MEHRKTQLAAAVGAALLLGAGAAQAQNLQVQLYGQVNRALMFADDGQRSKTFFVDGESSGTRFGIQGTSQVMPGLRAGARFEVEYELLFTNRLVLQPLFEAEVFGKSDPERGIGAGLSSTDLGFRLRYEFRREVAPYVGVTWRNKWGKTADFAEAAGEDSGGARFVTGLRLWF